MVEQFVLLLLGLFCFYSYAAAIVEGLTNDARFILLEHDLPVPLGFDSKVWWDYVILVELALELFSVAKDR